MQVYSFFPFFGLGCGSVLSREESSMGVCAVYVVCNSLRACGAEIGVVSIW